MTNKWAPPGDMRDNLHDHLRGALANIGKLDPPRAIVMSPRTYESVRRFEAAVRLAAVAGTDWFDGSERATR